MSHFVLKVFLDPMKSSEVWKAGEQSNYRINWDVSNEAIVYIYFWTDKSTNELDKSKMHFYLLERFVLIDYNHLMYIVYCISWEKIVNWIKSKTQVVYYIHIHT